MNKFHTPSSLFRSVVLPIASVAVLSAGVCRAAPIVIDDFVNDLSPTTDDFYLDGSMLGGEVDSLLGSPFTDATVQVSGGAMTVSSVTNMSEASLPLYYDGNDGDSAIDQTGLGGLDLTDGGANDRFVVELGALTGTIQISVQVFTDGSNWSIFTVSDITEAGSVEILFSDFPATVGAGADMSNAGAINLSIYVDQGDEVTLNSFAARPEFIPDTVSPTVKVTGASALKKPKRTHTVKGTASDDVGVTRVEVKVPGKPFKKAKLKASGKWTFRARGLGSGKNRIKIRAFDAAGNQSKIKIVKATGL